MRIFLAVLWVLVGLGYIVSGQPASPLFTGVVCLLLALRNFTDYLEDR